MQWDGIVELFCSNLTNCGTIKWDEYNREINHPLAKMFNGHKDDVDVLQWHNGKAIQSIVKEITIWFIVLQ